MWGGTQVSNYEKKNIRRHWFTSSINRRIRVFHVVVVHGRQRYVPFFLQNLLLL